MTNRIDAKLDAADLRFAIVVSRFNDFITSRLLDGAREALIRQGAKPDNITEVWVPGAWELPLAAQALVRSGQYDALVCLGCVLRGETTHHVHIGGEASKGLAQVSLQSGIPIGFGVLTPETLEQAIERAGGKAGNKGAEAAMGALEMANLLRHLSPFPVGERAHVGTNSNTPKARDTNRTS